MGEDAGINIKDYELSLVGLGWFGLVWVGAGWLYNYKIRNKKAHLQNSIQIVLVGAQQSPDKFGESNFQKQPTSNICQIKRWESTKA